ncbi:hypothetical protein SAMN00790413_04250 [Deinococcus hopiensis KR-140]|uniref:Uncharacterized protein n=1 Tax=Deinococcus hopiensis KR-140 TaxID=695939 RepID=A0A1W1UPZ8_9DEIO|nr:hypothetical protein SAMN00790413_04250 [Deinococcus hopiensis KR-140]
MKHPWADAGYTGKLAGEQGTFLDWTLESLVRPAKHLGTERRTSTTCGGAQGFYSVETALGRGADLCLALEIQAHGQGR